MKISPFVVIYCGLASYCIITSIHVKCMNNIEVAGRFMKLQDIKATCGLGPHDRRMYDVLKRECVKRGLYTI